MHLVVGLGNPEPQYRGHRHNAGFMVADRVHARANGSEWREKFLGLAARAVLAGREVTLLKPQTYMNLSGRAVLKAVTGMGLKPADILVVHDDLDIAFGEVRVKQGGGHGGHNGLRDITAAIGPDYARVRIGIGRPPGVIPVERWVLMPFSNEEQAELDGVLTRATDAVEAVVSGGLAAAMNKHNAAKKGAAEPKGHKGRG